MVKKYSTKPCEIEALEWTGTNDAEISKFIYPQDFYYDSRGDLFVETLEGVMSNFEIGNLYDLNKKAVAKLKPLTRTDLKKKLREVKFWMKTNEYKYYMLLNRELCDFTLFNIGTRSEFRTAAIISGLEECLANRGLVVAIDKAELMNAYEIWIKIDDKPFAYYLFPYDEGVIDS